MIKGETHNYSMALAPYMTVGSAEVGGYSPSTMLISGRAGELAVSGMYVDGQLGVTLSDATSKHPEKYILPSGATQAEVVADEAGGWGFKFPIGTEGVVSASLPDGLLNSVMPGPIKGLPSRASGMNVTHDKLPYLSAAERTGRILSLVVGRGGIVQNIVAE